MDYKNMEKVTPIAIVQNAQTPVVAIGVTPERLRNLRWWNGGLSILHFVQATVIAVLSTDFSIPVRTSFIDGPPENGGGELVTGVLFSIRVGVIIALFLYLAALDHFLTATFARKLYEADLKRGINRFRWIEYSLSATLMIILLCLYWGITSINALVLAAAANVAMIFFGWLQERVNPPGRTSTNMLPFYFGALVGIGPWVAMGINIGFYTSASTYIFAILIVEGILFFVLVSISGFNTAE
jgi:Heliorhodopsin